MKRFAAIGLLVSTVSSAARPAHAQGADANAQADAAYKEAQRLHAAGDDASACPKYAESRRLAPEVGVTLHLADCYSKTGKTASAFKEFQEAEKMARAKGDTKRADLAAQRAAALAPSVGRLTVEVAPDAEKAGQQLQLDGAPLPSSSWNTAVPVDAGDHSVVVTAPGQPSRTLSVHVDAGGTAKLATGLAAASAPPAFVIASAPAAATPPAAPKPTAPSTPATAPAAPPASTSTTPASDLATSPVPDRPKGSPGQAGARWAAGGLMLAGAVGVGIGTYLVSYKTQDMVNGQLCDPHLLPHAVPEAAVAFSVGGALLLTGVVLFYANWPHKTELALAPSVVPGGGGTVLRGTF
jgi:hypothetical protein